MNEEKPIENTTEATPAPTAEVTRPAPTSSPAPEVRERTYHRERRPYDSGDGDHSSGMKSRRRPHRRRKGCLFCIEKINTIDYKNISRLRKFLSDRAKMLPRRQSGTCAKHQRRLQESIKRAREMALLPYVIE